MQARLRGIALLLILTLAAPTGVSADEGHGERAPRGPGSGGPPDGEWAAAGSLPDEVLAKQSTELGQIPTLAHAMQQAVAAARDAAAELLADQVHAGRRIHVPTAHPTIQAAIDAAEAGDIVVVAAGTWNELLTLKDGVKLISDASDDGDTLVPVEGARLRLPRRALRTIIDGTGRPQGPHGLIDCPPGCGRLTVVDGFTLQNLPAQNHHRPGHAHAVNLRGASPLITNCLITDNGSTGIGSHVVYRDQGEPMPTRDFRWANVKHEARAVIYRNIVQRNVGRGIGCNHFAAPWILGNEVLLNDDAELGEGMGPGLGVKHGAAPTVIGNLVHFNPGGGIACKAGEAQGAHPIDRPTRPVLKRNVIWANGAERPALACRDAGTKRMPARIVGNFVFAGEGAGIGVSGTSITVLEDNLVARVDRQGIALAQGLVLRLVGNRVTECGGPGITMAAGVRVREMTGNASIGNDGPAYVTRGATIGRPDTDR